MTPLEQRIVECVQGEVDWLVARHGCATGSRVADCIAKRKRVKEGAIPEEMACRRDLRLELACELLTGRSTDNYVSRWMKEGKDKEPLARVEYELRFGAPVRQVGFIYHPKISRAGVSPDGLVGKHGAVEFKCPKLETHLQYLINGVIPDEYLPQCLWYMAVNEELDWVDFVSYHEAPPDDYQMFVRRLERTSEAEAVIRGMEAEVEQFLSEVDATLAKIKGSRKLVTV